MGSGGMNYGLTETQTMVRDLGRQIAEEKIRPVAAHYDETGEFPWEIVKVLADADLMGVYIPEEYGGSADGTPVMNMCVLMEELSRACGGIALAFGGSGLGSLPILISGSEEQKKRFLPDVAAGKRLAAFAITEANAGSDAAAIQTTAVKDGDGYVLNGTKQWISNGGEAEIYVVFALTDRAKGARGATAFILEKGVDGFSFGKKEEKLGIRGSTTRELIFENVRVPEANRLGREGTGFMVAMKTFDASRPGIAAQAVGIAQGALDYAVSYARTRKQFGRSIASFQGVGFMLADMAMKTEAARALVYATARHIDAGAKRPTKYAAMSKCFASDVAMQVTTDAIQVLGGYGYMKEYPVEKYFRDAKITQIYEGTNQIQRDEIARALVRESAGKREG